VRRLRVRHRRRQAGQSCPPMRLGCRGNLLIILSDRHLEGWPSCRLPHFPSHRATGNTEDFQNFSVSGFSATPVSVSSCLRERHPSAPGRPIFFHKASAKIGAVAPHQKIRRGRCAAVRKNLRADGLRSRSLCGPAGLLNAFRNKRHRK
jgi:hypothetical protein